MPLKQGSDGATIGDNVKELRKSGRPFDQAVAIALKEARKHHNEDKKKKDRK
jgi:hypothetical protein